MKPYCACIDESACTHYSSLIPPIVNAKGKRRKLTGLRADPSRTTALRGRFLAEMSRRFKRLRKEVLQLIVTEDALGIKKPKLGLSKILGNAEAKRWRFLTSEKKVGAFKIWLQDKIDTGILRVGDGEDAWTAKYIESAYKTGRVRAYADSIRGTGIPGSARQFGLSAFAQPETISKLRLLATRTFEDLEGVTKSMASKMNRTLAQGLADGKHPNQIGREMANTINLPLARARTIARTEIMHAHAEGQLDSFEELGVEELGVMVEWSTAGDDSVCPLCQPLEGIVLKVKEARGMIPRHPNCRCTWIPANVTESEAKQTRTKGAITKAVEKSIDLEKAGVKPIGYDEYKPSPWIGGDKTFVTKKTQRKLRG